MVQCFWNNPWRLNTLRYTECIVFSLSQVTTLPIICPCYNTSLWHNLILSQFTGLWWNSSSYLRPSESKQITSPDSGKGILRSVPNKWASYTDLTDYIDPQAAAPNATLKEKWPFLHADEYKPQSYCQFCTEQSITHITYLYNILKITQGIWKRSNKYVNIPYLMKPWQKV